MGKVVFNILVIFCFAFMDKSFCSFVDNELSEFEYLESQLELTPKSKDAERVHQWNNFKNAKNEIKQFQQKYKSATFKINKFALMSEEEQRKYFSAVPDEMDQMKTKSHISQNNKKLSNISIPSSFDWKLLGKVTPPKDQLWQACGSCYAFAAMAMIESQYLIRFNLSLNLSEQYAINCETQQSAGCNGGNSLAVFKLAAKSGIPSETCEPYTAKNGTCSKKCNNQPKYRITNYTFVGNDESTYPAALYSFGPLIFNFYVPKAFYYYESGVLDVPRSECTDTKNAGIHVMNLIGYTKDYWIAKNSFGPNWGENGFVRFKRGVNFCNMTWGAFSLYVDPNMPLPINSTVY